ncbi:MAG: pitrilysin family protein [Acidobacteriota bacterium]
MRKLASLALLSGLLVAAPIVFAQAGAQAPGAPQKVSTVEGITEYRMANGLKILLFPDSSKPTVTVNVTYLVGSRHEGYGESGMAHLLEHMLFKGTQKRESIMKLLTEKGADWNGTTWYDRTNYFETLDATTDDNLRWALEMEADRMVNSRVSRVDLDTEMTVVRNEFERGENDPSSVLEERVLSTAYLWHNYGRSTIGARSDIENVPIERLQAFYRKYYQPDNSVLVIAGKFDQAKALTWLTELFGAIPKPTRVLETTYTAEPPQDGEREVVLHRVGDTQNLLVAYHIPSAADPDSSAFDVLTFILSNAPSGRLYKALVENKLATSAGANEYELHDPGVFLISAEMLKTQDFKAVEDALFRVVDGLTKEPPTKAEVDRAKNNIIKNFELAMNNTASIARALSENIASGDWRLRFLDRDQIEKVTPEDVVRIAQKYLLESNRTIGRFIPAAESPKRAEITPTRDLNAALNGYTGRAASEEGEAFDPSPANIESRVTRVTLPSGLKLVMLPKKNRGGTVVASLSFHWGNLQSLTGKGGSPAMTGSLLMRGTQKHTRQELQDEFDRLKTRVNVNGGLTGANASVNGVRSGLVASLKLIAEILQQPTFPAGDFDEIQRARIAGIEGSRSEPATIAGTARNKHVNKYPLDDPRAALSVDESLARIRAATLDQAKQFYKDFYGASNGEIAVVGDFDPAEIRPLMEELFGKWKSPKPYARIPDEYQAVGSVNLTLEAPDKANAYLYAIQPMAMDQQDPDYPALYLANIIFGSDPKSRVWRRIREKDGLSYGTNTGFSAGTRDKVATLTLGSTFAPENVLKVEAAFKEELALMLDKGFNDEELKIAKDAFLQERLIGRTSDQSLAGLFTSQAELGRTMQRDIDLENAVRNATVAQLNAVVKKWIKPDSISYFKAGDFKKAGITK